MGFADGGVVQFEVVGAVAAEEELALLFQEQLVDGLILLYDYDGNSCSQFLVQLYALIAYPVVGVRSLPYFFPYSHQDLAQGIVAFSFDDSPIFLILSALLETVYQISGMSFCQFGCKLFVPLEFVAQQFFHCAVLASVPVYWIGNGEGNLFKFFVIFHLIEGLPYCRTVCPCCLVCNRRGGVQNCIE